MTRKQRLIRMILSKRLKKYGSVFTQPGTHRTLRKPINFASLLRAQSQAKNISVLGKDTPGQEDTPHSESSND